ncbi:translocator protein [Cordyceps fumosorosea ARSEF 2679]|uniref:Translocator protein n=1 Tax=Cordyceps fumosorosea (strain ARSEF 2679) TaxID=1081104 RepID=A0A162LNY0_CORFA|nr:translocator protein [Cordyceps fumosorosea ARSEF 2679]OAA73504.1 translocator protein [Cordyceps fumosorosea ARSEF 2679]
MTTYIPSLTLPIAALQHAPTSILLPIALGTAIGYSTKRNPSHNLFLAADKTVKTYHALKQPPLHPPAYVFGPVWTVLYGLMGYAAHRVAAVGLSPLSSPATAASTKHSLTVYTIQLGLNLAWMPLFFGARRPVEATADLVALLGLNGWLAWTWSAVDETAAWLQLPYLGWLAFATYLSAGAGYLNGWDMSDEALEAGKKAE